MQSVSLWWYWAFFQVPHQVLHTVCYTLVVLFFLQVQHQVLYTVCNTWLVLYFIQVQHQVLCTVCYTLVVLYFLQVQHQVLYTVCYTMVLLYFFSRSASDTVYSLFHFGGTVLSSKSSIRYCIQSVTLWWYCTFFKSLVSYCTLSASAASVSLYICPRSLDMGTPRTASRGGNKTYSANQVNITVLKLG